MRKKTIIIVSALAVITALLASLFILLRTDYVSKKARALIEPALESFYDGEITIKQVAVNPFPFFIELKDIEVLRQGESTLLLSAERIRAYISINDFLSRKITVSPLSFQGVYLELDTDDILSLNKLFSQASVTTPQKGFTVNLEKIELKDGRCSFFDKRTEKHVMAESVSIEALLNQIYVITASIDRGLVEVPDYGVIPFSVYGKVKSDGKKSELLASTINVLGSSVQAKGNYTLDEGGVFDVNAAFLVKSVKEFFNLKETGEGRISVKGKVVVKNDSVDLALDTEGDIYFESLKELFDIHDLEMMGRLSFDGKVTGTYPDIQADGTGQITKGLFDFFPVDHLKGSYHYEDMVFTFTDVLINAYKGSLKGNGSLLLENNDFHAKARGADINSQELFRSLDWDSPFPEGLVEGDGELHVTTAKGISFSGSGITYRNTGRLQKSTVPFVDKITGAQGDFSFENDLLTLDLPRINGGDSKISLKGTVHLEEEQIALKASLDSPDAAKLLNPYFDGLQGALKLKAHIGGSFDEPEISGSLAVAQGKAYGFSFKNGESEFELNKNTLNVKKLLVRQKDASLYSLRGVIKPSNGKGFSSVQQIGCDLEFSLSQGNIQNLLSSLSYDIPLKGIVNAQGTIKGEANNFKGQAQVSLRRGDVYGQPVESAFIKADFDKEKVRLTSIKINEKSMAVTGRADVSFKGKYDVSLSSPSISLKKLAFVPKDFPLSGDVGFKLQGSGTVKEPKINLYLETPRQLSYKGQKTGKGSLQAFLVKDEWTVNGQFFDDFMTISGKGHISGKPDYNVKAKLKSHRYDFLLPLIYKDVPEGATILLGGNVGIKGTGKDYNLRCQLSYLQLGLKTFRLVNRDDIEVEFDGDQVTIRSLSMTGRDAEFSASGKVSLHKEYNVKVRGTINLNPFGEMAEAVKHIKGRSEFNLTLAGPWHKPSLRGTLKIQDAFIAPENFPSLIGPINGEAAFSDDKFIINPTEAAFGGGTIKLTGTGYLEGAQFKSFYGDLGLDKITVIPEEGVSIVFGGKLLLDFSPQRQRIDGTIRVNQAKIDSRFDVKSSADKKTKAINKEQDGVLGKTRLNIQIDADKKLYIDNEFIKTHLDFKDLLVRGTPVQPVVLGTVASRKGKIFLRGNVFDIVNGKIDFVNPAKPEPRFAIQAETRVREMTVHHGSREYKIFLNIEGTLEDLYLSFSSDDTGLTEKDMISILALGSRGDEMVTVGKRLIDNKLHIMYSRPTESSETQTSGSNDIVRLEYSLGKNVSLVGERNEKDSVGASLKFRFEF